MCAGRLLLSLDKDSYEVLGVEGKASRFNHRSSSRFGGNGDIGSAGSTDTRPVS